jgi:urease accessory protein
VRIDVNVPAHVVAQRIGDTTVLTHARATSPLRLIRPTFPGGQASAVCLVTFGGGLVDEDALEIDLEVEAGATLVVFTQASTKVFRGSSRQTIRANVQGTLVLLPDPVACFGGAHYRQRVDVALENGGACVLLDGFTSGRPAYGERWAFDRLDLRTRITEAGLSVVDDALVLDRADGSIASRMDRFEAMQTLIARGAAVHRIADDIGGAAAVRADLVAAPSPLPTRNGGGAIVRIAATRPATALVEVRKRLRKLAEIGVVDPFASRH